MMTIDIAFVLGFLQGLTEFLPISSSGHLVIAESWFHLRAEENLLFDLILHVATLLAVCVYFRARLAALTRSLAAWPRGGWLDFHSTPDRRMITAVAVSTLVTGGMVKLGGLEPLHDWMREHPSTVGFALIATGILLLCTRLRAAAAEGGDGVFPVNFWIFALILGAAQAFAVLPGISRSGTTVAVALLLGSRKEAALEYSFIMAIPIILIAFAAKLMDGAGTVAAAPAMAGFAASLVSGYVFLALLAWITNRGKLYRFAFYTIPVGFAVIWYF